jgi:hypothetical protein
MMYALASRCIVIPTHAQLGFYEHHTVTYNHCLIFIRNRYRAGGRKVYPDLFPLVSPELPDFDSLSARI